jgi:hypothetical protein
MKRTMIGALAASVLSVGCENMSNTQQGAAVGGILGAGAGALIGDANHGKAGTGALIGGAVGALAGGLVGSEKDKAEKQALERQRDAQARGPALGLTDVANLAAQNMSDDIIINQIRATHSAYNLSPSDITYLKQSGVSDRVIVFMQNTARRYVERPVVVEQPVYVERPVYVAPPPPPVGIGFSYTRVVR